MSEKLEKLIIETADKAQDAITKSNTFGAPINVDGATLIPVFKTSFGFAGGGFDSKNNNISGGAGAGVTTEPYAYIKIKDGETTVESVRFESQDKGKLLKTVWSILKKDKK